ncbi:MAG: hypothetical protein KIT84_41730 [Labilithrix sp.]|nr:hypothetical protein [Labilithrix sp.]MCW5817594.1 hypothetical protein [Labilithrix sp.]
MALGSRRWVLAVMGAACVAFACNAIVGVEDVKLKGSGGTRLQNEGGPDDDDDFGDDDDDGPRDSGPTVEKDRPQLALGFSHTCARMLDGTVRCWGANVFGQLGDGAEVRDAQAPIPPDSLRAKDVPNVKDAIQIAAGSNHTCILKASGKVLCWGDNFYGQLGDGTELDSSNPVEVKELDDAVTLSAGGNVTCVIRQSKKAACWGYNFRGGLGDGTTADSTKPVTVNGLDDVAQIAPAANHTCAVKTNGELWCWGGAVDGQLGTGSLEDTTKPTRVTALSDVVEVAVASAYSCARTRSGTIHCWGRNSDGQLGAGAISTAANPSPIAVAITDAISLGAGSTHTCAVRKAGNVMCWGNGVFGQLGIGPVDAATNKSPIPVDVQNVQTARFIWNGGGRTCALTSDDKALCWGRNGDGQLGIGSTEDKNVPTPVSDF